MSEFQRKYGESTTIPIKLFEVDGVDLRVDAVYVSGDVKITKNEGAEANTTNSFTDEGSMYSIVLSATEMQAARINLILIDQDATKVWLDTTITIETYGNASAQHAFDLDTASASQSVDNDVILQTLPIATDIVSAGAITTLSGAVVNVDLVDTLTTYTGDTPQTADHTAAIADIPTVSEFNARTLPSASYFDFTSDFVQVGTNNDKTGYEIAGTLNRLDDLENLAQTDVVTSGAIQTAVGVVVNVGICQQVNTIAGTKQTLDDLNDISTTQVNTEVLDVLTVDTFPEASYPGATASILNKINYTFSITSNKYTQTSTTQLLRNSTDSGDLGTATVSDDGTTFIRGNHT